MTIKPAWIAVDWGTSNLRVWAMSEDDKVISEARSDQGMNSLAPKDFSKVLGQLLKDWDTKDAPIIGCGMVGARQGWAEAPYRSVQCPPLSPNTLTRATSDELSMWIVPGLSQIEPAPDVMRGEETQIAGFLAQNPEWSGHICLPGTHTKWVRIFKGEVVFFHTYMSGELFSLLSDNSVLRHSITEHWDNDVFATTVRDVLAGKETSNPFHIRAAQLLGASKMDEGRAKLSAKLIGYEVESEKTNLMSQGAAIIGNGQMTDAYRIAISCVRQNVEVFDNTPMTIAGLALARKGLIERT